MRKYTRTNEILEDHGEWLLVDISTSKHQNATMAVDTDIFEAHKGGRISAWSSPHHKYIHGRYLISGKVRSFHRSVIDAGDLDVDHIRHGTMVFIDNRRSNLREVTSSQNNMNCSIRSDSKTGMTGVYWNKELKKWKASIGINGKQCHLGYYDNIDFAIGVRQQAEREYFGEYAFKG